jgi:PAS domain S-box-containing protein
MNDQNKTKETLIAELETLRAEVSALKSARSPLAEQQQLIAETALRIRQSLNLLEVLATTAEEVRWILQCDRVVIYQFCPDGSGEVVVESVGEGWTPILGKVIHDPCLEHGWSEKYRQGRTTDRSDLGATEIDPCYVSLMAQFQVRANLVVPILPSDRLWGLLIVHQCHSPRQWNSSDADFLCQLATQVGIAIQQAALVSQLQTELQERKYDAPTLTAEQSTIDITDRKQAEAALRQFDRRWRSLLDNVQLAVVGVDRQGNVEYANPFFLKLTDLTAAEALGKNWIEHFIPGDWQADVQDCLQAVREKNSSPRDRHPLLTKSGEERTIAWSHTLLQDLEGNALGTISIGEDITERYQLERMKAEFISVVSHELRTPLTSMQAALSLLADKIVDPTSEEGQDVIQIAASGVDRLVHLVNDILDLERLESGKIRLKKRWCDPAQLMNRAIAQMQEMANQAGVVLHASPHSCALYADVDRLLQVMTNRAFAKSCRLLSKRSLPGRY